ncbi:OmpW family outer membrane protein [Brevundimonas sp.]|uniref:OmpW/AlkL family protein n=1 Tax=Brevundimonas sp. TaxID=1871086 RepID=UPI0028967D2E|nr:OmpW family outer membrane protein [Brevundimonas sp.]
MKTSAALLAAASVLALAGTASAQAQPSDPVGKGTLIVTARMTGVLPQADDAIVDAAGAASGLNADVSDDWMPTLGFTYFVSDHWAVEAILGATQHEVKAKGAGMDVAVHETWVLPPIVTAQYRPTPNNRVSPYVGAGVSYMAFFDGKDKNGFTVDIDDGFGVALQAGADINLSGPWTLNVDAKKVWFDTDASINGGALKSSVSLDPWVVSVGVGRKF